MTTAEITPDAAPVASPPWTQTVKRVLPRQLSGITLLPALVVVIIVGAVVNDAFLSRQNIINLLQQSSELSVVVVASTLILIVGKFDLSLESVFGLAPMVAAFLVSPLVIGGSGWNVNPFLAILACLAVGALVGVINGFLVVRLKLNAFITTLAALILLRGVTLGVSGGKTLFDLPEPMLFLGKTTFIGIPISILLAGGLFIVAGLVLRYHTFGRQLYAIGGNPDAARAAGISVDRTIRVVFVIAGVLAALAGLMLAGRVESVTAAQGQNLIFTVFAAAVIGGISLDGGKGTMLGALTGVLLLGCIQNILTLAQLPTFWIDASFGAIILVALIITRLTSARDSA
ncbi:ABC transporter permease [Mycolicibacterium mageritense]|nr:ABC transporter permease [Mycolicibacterium mageritense]